MSRSNKLLNMPIVNAISNNGIPNFVSLDEFINTETDNEIKEFLLTYKEELNSIKTELSYLSLLEILITQLRCRQNIKSEIKLYVSQIYVYARSTFYRNDKQIKDIRVLMGSVSELGENMDTLSNNIDFMNEAIAKLYNAMSDEIKRTNKSIYQLLSKQSNV
jgi:hypothetical protein